MHHTKALWEFHASHKGSLGITTVPLHLHKVPYAIATHVYTNENASLLLVAPGRRTRQAAPQSQRLPSVPRDVLWGKCAQSVGYVALTQGASRQRAFMFSQAADSSIIWPRYSQQNENNIGETKMCATP